jgi:flagellar hook assembly protein FlgD
VLDLAGRRVRGLLDEPFLEAGPHSLAWDGRDEAGSLAPTGIYLVTLETPTGKALRKVTVLR